MTTSMPSGKDWREDGLMQLALKGSRRSHPSSAEGGSLSWWRFWRRRRRWEVAAWASGLMSAHEYVAIVCPALRRASRPVEMPAQISTTCSGRLGGVYRLQCRRDGFVCQGWVRGPVGGGVGVGCGDGCRWDSWVWLTCGWGVGGVRVGE